MFKIGIIGGGFAGTMTAVHLIEKIKTPCQIIVMERDSLSKGIAYNPYSNKHLLNVIASKMSAFQEMPHHFLDWVMRQPQFADKDPKVIAGSFLPRKLYGIYLKEIWNHSMSMARDKQIDVIIEEAEVKELNCNKPFVDIKLDNAHSYHLDYCVIATGNSLPRNPTIANSDFYQSSNYFQNPWKIESVQNTAKDHTILIIGNGLTMVDTVFGLLEFGFKGKIISISPHGFNILPHRHNGFVYTKLKDELKSDLDLLSLVKLVNKHIKTVREFGVSAEPIIDSLRPYSQKIWMALSNPEKKLFMSRLRHLWGVARHRIPLHSHDKIQQWRIDGKLRIIAGNLLNMTETEGEIRIEFYDKKEGLKKMITVSRVINCTGPDTNIQNFKDGFLKSCLIQGILTQDDLKLGINADIETFQIKDKTDALHMNLFTLGSNLKGLLWESTAVNELRSQAEQLANKLVERIRLRITSTNKS